MMRILTAVFIMAVVTYVPRALPILFFNKKIESRFIKSFLHYIPFAVLGAMIFPNIIYSTGSITTGIIGLITAVIFSYLDFDLLKVAIITVSVVYISQLCLVNYFPF